MVAAAECRRRASIIDASPYFFSPSFRDKEQVNLQETRVLPIHPFQHNPPILVKPHTFRYPDPYARTERTPQGVYKVLLQTRQPENVEYNSGNNV